MTTQQFKTARSEAATASSAQQKLFLWWRDKGTYLAFILLVIVASLISRNFLSPNNLMNVMRAVAVNGIMAVGMTLLLLCGKFDLSAGTVVSMAGVLAISFERLGVAPAALLALLAGGVVGGFNGLLVTRLGINAFISTLATSTILLSVLLEFTQARFLVGTVDAFTVVGRNTLWGIPLSVMLMFSIAAVAELVLRRSLFGRYIYAIGGNEEASRWSGISPKTIQMTLFILMGILSSAAGLVLSSRLNYGSSNLGSGMEFDAITATLLGGTKLSGGEGSVLQTIVGVLILGILTNILQLAGFPYEVQLAGKALVFLLVVWMNGLSGRS